MRNAVSLALVVIVAGCAVGQVRPVSGDLSTSRSNDEVLSPPDGGALDSAPARSQAALDGGGAADLWPRQDTNVAPRLVVTELMVDPDAASDDQGEWIELYNPGPLAVDLHGFLLLDDGNNSHTISRSLVIAPGGYRVLGVSDDPAKNGGVDVDYPYGDGFFLSNKEDEVVVRDPGGALVARLAYSTSAGFPVRTGASASLSSVSADPNVAGNWCVEHAVWPGSAGDRGTPGSAAGCAP